MQATHVDVFDTTVQKSYIWVRDCAQKLEITSIPEAYRTIRSVLLSIRDQLDDTTSAHFAAQLPMLLRGMYFDGWNPQRKNHVRTAEEFEQMILGYHDQRPFKKPEEMARAVYEVSCMHVSGGEMRKVLHCLAAPIRQMLTGSTEEARSNRLAQ